MSTTSAYCPSQVRAPPRRRRQGKQIKTGRSNLGPSDAVAQVTMISSGSPAWRPTWGVASTHINHVTPRVLDIDDLYASMQAQGVTMIDDIQGPPRWDGPDVLLRQTSCCALAEPRSFRETDGTVAPRVTCPSASARSRPAASPYRRRPGPVRADGCQGRRTAARRRQRVSLGGGAPRLVGTHAVLRARPVRRRPRLLHLHRSLRRRPSADG